MKLPKEIKEKIALDQETNAWVQNAISRFSPWIKENRMVFFEEYTDHSIGHVEDVLQAAVDIMSAESLSLMTPQDAAVLTLGVCLHDCAMHLSDDGFYSLIKPGSRWETIKYFGDKPWSDLWIDFIGEARRFDGRKLYSIFGDTKPIKEPPKEAIELSKRDRFLIGEFLRRHHARLAHEIAVYGVPGPDGNSYSLFADDKNFEKINLAGLVARSHGMPLRSCVDYLRKERAHREFQGVRAVYLMVLLRVADYVQLQARRAPSEILEVRRLNSPLSQGEWKVHSCISNIRFADEDPEAIYVDARPKDVHTYIRVKGWLDGIQKELDLSWAILGEVYGRYEKERLNKLTLNLRRIRSSLDDVEMFSKDVDYVPAKIAFDAANSDLLKLLIGPLYGERPSVGVRELVQNSIDAVREFADLSVKHKGYENADRLSIDSDVLVEIDYDSEDGLPCKITVSDRGVGMTLDVIKNYFLMAGASFRNSDLWKKEHEDEGGDSRVLRSGRFGVGALAAFLIGNEIDVLTRHVDENEGMGYSFKATLDEDAISISRKSCQVGTSVVVNIPESMRLSVENDLFDSGWRKRKSSSSLDFYLLDSPSLKVIDRKEGVELGTDVYVPNIHDTWLGQWRYFDHDKYDRIFWTYEAGVSREKLEGKYTYVSVDHYPDFLCNGIVVCKYNYTRNRWLLADEKRHPYGFDAPTISLFDRNGILPLNLQRTEIMDGGLSFSDDLWRSVADDLVAYALETAPNNDKKGISGVWLRGGYPGFDRTVGKTEFSSYMSYVNISPRWFLSKEGVGYIDQSILTEFGYDAVVSCYGHYGKEENEISFYKNIVESLLEKNVFIDQREHSEYSINNKKGLIRQILVNSSLYHEKVISREFVGRYAIIRKNFINDVMDATRLAKDIKKHIENANYVFENDDWKVVAIGDPMGNKEFYERILRASLPKGVSAISVDIFGDEIEFEEKQKQGVVAKRWMEVLGKAIIPYNEKERKKIYLKAYQQLLPQIEMHRDKIANEKKKK